jgi:DNA-binding winged helix-turn-helix (wHTH) protein
MMSQQDNLLYTFGPFKLDPAERQLWKDSQQLDLAPREFDTLCYLVNNHGRLTQKDQLMSAIWPDSFVEESNLNLIISNLRKALGDNATNPTFIETVRKQGFRFIAAVEVLEKVGVETGTSPAVSNGFRNGNESSLPSELSPIESRRKQSVFHRYPRTLIGVTVGILVLATTLFIIIERKHAQPLTGSEISSPFDESEIRRVVKESQMYETLTVYTDPTAFDPRRLSDYWVSEDQGGKR